MRICSHSLCNAPLNMVEEDKESASTGSLGLVDTRRMELSISMYGRTYYAGTSVEPTDRRVTSVDSCLGHDTWLRITRQHGCDVLRACNDKLVFFVLRNGRSLYIAELETGLSPAYCAGLPVLQHSEDPAKTAQLNYQ